MTATDRLNAALTGRYRAQLAHGARVMVSIRASKMLTEPCANVQNEPKTEQDGREAGLVRTFAHNSGVHAEA